MSIIVKQREEPYNICEFCEIDVGTVFKESDHGEDLMIKVSRDSAFNCSKRKLVKMSEEWLVRPVDAMIQEL